MNDHIGSPINGAATAGGLPLPVLDDRVIGNWQAVLPPQKIGGLIAAHIAESRTQIRQLREAGKVGADGLSGIGALAHDLKSVCGNIGMVRAQTLAADLEAACRAGHHHDVRRTLHDLEQAVGAAAAALIARYPDAAEAI